jgi:uncharacterized protein (TIGR00290 family)
MSKVVAFSSGGKDSIHSLYVALEQGINVDYLLFVKNGSKAHRINSWLLKLVSETLGIPALTTEKELPMIRKTLKDLKATKVISGVMITPEHIDWYKQICDPINVEHYAPLWGKNPITALEEIRNLGFQTKIIELDTSWGSRKSWIGKELGQNIIQEMKELEKEQKINPSGELGAYHTFVLDCPLYNQRVKILDSEVFWEGTKGYFIIKKAELRAKR